MDISSKQLLADIIQGQLEYANVFRKTLSLSRHGLVVGQKILKEDDLFNEVIRESDLEHIGHLPYLATMIYPHLENMDKVDLPKVLLYLAIHETPERLVGDVLHDDKTKEYNNYELSAAKKLLSGPYEPYYKLYEEFHYLKNIDATFAHSIDRIAAFIYYEVQSPETRIPRWKEMGLTVDRVRGNSSKYMEWDSTMKNLYEEILNNIENQDKEHENTI